MENKVDTTDKANENNKITGIKALKRFFESGIHGRKVTLDELKALSSEDRKELTELAEAEVNKE